MYHKLLQSLLYIINKTAPAENPQLNYHKKWKANSNDLEKIDTGYGFSVDIWPISIRVIDYIFSFIPIYDKEPSINPKECCQELDRKYGNMVPKEAVNVTSLIDFLINNTGSYFVQDGVADFSSYEQYDVRDGFFKYGGKVFIKNNVIDHYEYLGQVYPGDDERMDKIIRASLCLKMMVEMHALKVHLCNSQRVNFEYHDKYGKGHKLADFLYLATFESFQVNRRIPILVSPHGIVARLFALTTESFNQLVHDVLQSPRFNRDDILGYEGTIWRENMSKYCTLVDNFIHELDVSKEEQIDLSNFFIVSSAVHNQVGDSQLRSMVIDEFFIPKVYISQPGNVSELDQQLLISLLISVSGDHPLIIDENTDKVFEDEQQRQVWKKFRTTILNEYPDNNWWNPKTFELSVGF